MTIHSAYRASGDAGLSAGAQKDAATLDLFDLIALAWAERGVILLIFAVIFSIGAAVSLTMLTPSYQANSRLLVLLDSNDPTPGAAGSGGAFELDQVMQSEIEILNSDVVRRRAISEIGAFALTGEPSDQAALKALRSGFSVDRSPNASVLIARLEHPDPEIAALALNAIIDAYLTYRREVLIGDGVGGLADQRDAADAAYGEAQQRLDEFLRRHELADYDSALAAAIARTSSIQDRLLAAAADRHAARAAVDALSQRLSALPESIDLYVENGAGNRLLDLRIEREQLLARYQPDAPAVVAIDREIEELQGFLASGAAAGLGNVRTGPNPVRQALEADQLSREAAVREEAGRVDVLERQLVAARGEAARLRALGPEYQSLARELAARAETATRLAGQAAEASARRTAPGSADAVRIVERATTPAEASSMKKLGLLASFVAAAGIALFLGLIRGYWRRYLDPRRLTGPATGIGRGLGGPDAATAAAMASNAYPVMAPGAIPAAPVSPAQAYLADLPVLARVPERAPQRLSGPRA